ncbi:CHASE3 domain-containing protein [Dactylosporangium sp. NPDC050688]|uniref:CHASE3 domain-containing protein n=1 Tax=Dactylosporangium sp. NPDC050688 TaxID=3157217 RepID=UPI00340DD57F
MNSARGGLIRRMLLAAGALLLIVGATFSVLLYSIAEQRETARIARRSQEIFVAADHVDRLTADMQMTYQQFVVTADPGFRADWESARARLPTEAADLERLATTPAQQDLARHIAGLSESYIQDYATPAMAAAQRGDPSARSVETMQEGRGRIDELRTDLDTLRVNELHIIAAREGYTDTVINREIIAVVIGMIGSAIVIAMVSLYQTRVMVQPIRRGAVMANRLAAGHLDTRMPETGKAEIGQLERSFNIMAASLERSHNELRHLVETQTALRRVAVVVAKGAEPAGVLAAVVEELGRLIGTESARIVRYEPDGSAIIVASWGGPTLDLPVGMRLPLDGNTSPGRAQRTDRPVQLDRDEGRPGSFAARLREHGLRAGVDAPIYVAGRLWGVVIAGTTRDEALPPDAEERLVECTDLIGTAVAKAQAHADLVKSRARLVLATDQARRRIERDLHDSVQQRLISLALDVRRVEGSVPPEMAELRDQLSAVVTELAGTVDEVRELSRGVHPPILTEGGLRPALRTLARRSKIPVDLDVRLDSRLPETVEVAAYYVVAEALTNAAKHAQAELICVSVLVSDDCLQLTVRDDGVGGAVAGRGTGLVGLTDRVEALGGTLTVSSPPGEGTCLTAKLPLHQT